MRTSSAVCSHHVIVAAQNRFGTQTGAVRGGGVLIAYVLEIEIDPPTLCIHDVTMLMRHLYQINIIIPHTTVI